MQRLRAFGFGLLISLGLFGNTTSAGEGIVAYTPPGAQFAMVSPRIFYDFNAQAVRSRVTIMQVGNLKFYSCLIDVHIASNPPQLLLKTCLEQDTVSEQNTAIQKQSLVFSYSDYNTQLPRDGVSLRFAIPDKQLTLCVQKGATFYCFSEDLP